MFTNTTLSLWGYKSYARVGTRLSVDLSNPSGHRPSSASITNRPCDLLKFRIHFVSSNILDFPQHTLYGLRTHTRAHSEGFDTDIPILGWSKSWHTLKQTAFIVNLVHRYKRFGRTSCLYIQKRSLSLFYLKTEAAGSLETPVHIYRTTRFDSVRVEYSNFGIISLKHRSM
jgi:hypothetical protein